MAFDILAKSHAREIAINLLPISECNIARIGSSEVIKKIGLANVTGPDSETHMITPNIASPAVPDIVPDSTNPNNSDISPSVTSPTSSSTSDRVIKSKPNKKQNKANANNVSIDTEKSYICLS